MGLAACAGCFAQDDVTITLASGKKSYKVDDVKSMTFDGNKLVVTNQSDAQESYNLADIVSVSFDTTSGVSGLKVDGKLTISVKPGSDLIEIGGYDGKTKYGVAVYNLAGEKVLGTENWKGDAVDVSSLPGGVYVIKINNTTLKFRK